MGKIIGSITPISPPLMENGVFYDIDPPSQFLCKIFHRIMCEYRVPNNPDEYVVKGIPQGESKPESFVLRFTSRGHVVTRRSENQQGF